MDSTRPRSSGFRFRRRGVLSPIPRPVGHSGDDEECAAVPYAHATDGALDVGRRHNGKVRRCRRGRGGGSGKQAGDGVAPTMPATPATQRRRFSRILVARRARSVLNRRASQLVPPKSKFCEHRLADRRCPKELCCAPGQAHADRCASDLPSTTAVIFFLYYVSVTTLCRIANESGYGDLKMDLSPRESQRRFARSLDSRSEGQLPV